MYCSRCLMLLLVLSGSLAAAADNQLSEAEKQQGWILLFNGKTLDGWVTSENKPSQRPIDEGSINPHKSGHYMMIHEKKWENFVLQLDFKISKGCNSGIFFRTSSLQPRAGKDVGFNGIEIAIDDTATAGYHDTGAIYDLVKPRVNAMKPAGQWNELKLFCNRNLIFVSINGKRVSRMDTDQFSEPNKRPDGSDHKFDVVYKSHPRLGYIGLQDHGADCWYKNIKLKVLQ